MPTPTVFGQRLRERRETSDLTQAQLAERSSVPAAMISHFETGARSSASAATLVKLANALSTSVDYLMGRVEVDKPTGGQVGALLRAVDGVTAETMDNIVAIARSLQAREKGTLGALDHPPSKE